MKKVWINYWVDLITSVSFLLCAVTGVVFLFLPGLVSVTADEPTILGVSAAAWHWVHDWSGVVMTAGVGLHVALHLRWLVSMTRKLGRTTGVEHARAAGRSRSRTAAPAVDRAPVAAAEAAPSDGRTYPEASLERLRRLDAGTRGTRRYSRKAFLAGAAAAGGAALLGGWVMARDTSTATSPLAQSGDAWSEGGLESSGDGGGYGGGYGQGGSSGGSSPGSSGSGTTTGDRVVVDGACVGCGHCVPACPDGVLSWGDDGKVTASDPSACRLCGRCLQVCPVSAITLNG